MGYGLKPPTSNWPVVYQAVKPIGLLIKPQIARLKESFWNMFHMCTKKDIYLVKKNREYGVKVFILSQI